MRNLLILLIAFVIAASSLWVSTGEVDWSANGEDAISADTFLIGDHISNPAKKELTSLDLPAAAECLIHAIAELSISLRNWFYLPIHSLSRIQHYFLLL